MIWRKIQVLLEFIILHAFLSATRPRLIHLRLAGHHHAHLGCVICGLISQIYSASFSSGYLSYKDHREIFLAVIAALYVTMSVCRSVGWSVGLSTTSFKVSSTYIESNTYRIEHIRCIEYNGQNTMQRIQFTKYIAQNTMHLIQCTINNA